MKLKSKILITLNSIKRNYYNWRYWNNVYKNMMKYTQSLASKDKSYMLLYKNKPGIALSFDDSFRINDWYKYGNKIFGYYDVKVTFNINAIHHFKGKREHTQKEIDMLLELQSMGHEIGHHGFKHKKATDYSNDFGLDSWIEDEIVTLIDWMDQQSHSKTLEKFKKPVSFAFPHFLFDSKHVSELVPKYFKIVRGHLYKENLISFNHSGFTPSICLDGYYSYNLHYIKKIMRLVKKSGKNLIFTCHSILPKEFDWDVYGWGKEAKKSGTWRITPQMIQTIINEAREIGLEFYTTSEIAGIATFIDHNFEKCIRELISNPSLKWIPLSELSPIVELDLSNQGISNLDGIQYCVNLEKLHLGGNNITDFRLLKKLPKLKKINFGNDLKEKISNINY
ncbi:leucine-rich repeat domain-containing protein [Neobacillus niacini]|uniref:leucine-rich repeat domain-containing protein n=1 Tax=Neobacillus niacini TaxID=86668 RepID=UPI0028664DD3|nr:leucine-rich repeat domain-containing protein [Neobacillus niacini]MDR7000617.1 peptidoglycan/xylan/chitin deacetylase (PgdA/CDA1 family) [Neobacillus niacini]